MNSNEFEAHLGAYRGDEVVRRRQHFPLLFKQLLALVQRPPGVVHEPRAARNRLLVIARMSGAVRRPVDRQLSSAEISGAFGLGAWLKLDKRGCAAATLVQLQPCTSMMHADSQFVHSSAIL